MAAVHDESLHLQAEAGGVKFYDKWKIKEVSITTAPACPGCHFKIYTGQSKGTANDDVEQCIIDLLDSGEIDDEDDARALCEEIYGDDDG